MRRCFAPFRIVAGLAALLAFHRPGLPGVAAESRWALFNLPPPPSSTGLLLLSTRRAGGPSAVLWQSAERLATLVRSRNGRAAEFYGLYRVTLPPTAPAVVLPDPAPVRASPASR